MTIVLTLKLLSQLYLIKLSASILTNASTRFLYNTTWLFLQIYSPIRLKIIYNHCIATQYPCIFIVLLGTSKSWMNFKSAQYPCIFIVLLDLKQELW